MIRPEAACATTPDRPEAPPAATGGESSCDLGAVKPGVGALISGRGAAGGPALADRPEALAEANSEESSEGLDWADRGVPALLVGPWAALTPGGFEGSSPRAPLAKASWFEGAQPASRGVGPPLVAPMAPRTFPPGETRDGSAASSGASGAPRLDLGASISRPGAPFEAEAPELPRDAGTARSPAPPGRVLGRLFAGPGRASGGRRSATLGVEGCGAVLETGPLTAGGTLTLRFAAAEGDPLAGQLRGG